MKNFITAIFIFFSLHIFAYSNQIIAPELQNKITDNPNKFVDINIFFKDKFDYSSLETIDKTQPKQVFRSRIYNSLKKFSYNSQKDVLDFLTNLKANEYVKKIHSIPINNVLNCQIVAYKIKELTDFDEILFINLDSKQKMAFKPENSYEDRNREITWNVLKVNANDVWQEGYTGEGVLVAVIDTGVNYNHHDLMDHMWQDSEYPYHGYDFVNNDNNPIDDMGHGTHCAGTVAGDGTSGSQTGVAPDATIMALKVLDSEGSGTQSGVWEAMDFALQHNADVISMSLGWQHSWGVDRTAWRNAMISLEQAYIAASVAAGNEGDQQYTYPIPDNIRTPGDCPPPWLHPDQTLIGGTSAVISVGATNSSDNVTEFSGRGPVDWSDISPFNDYPYMPEMGLIRPDVVAPGANIKSLAYNNDTGYLSGWDGTSMAAPCVAGTIALMLSKNPILTPAQIDEILETTAVHLESMKNNNSGSGRIDALAAIEATPNPNMPPANVINPFPADNSVNVMTGIDFYWQDDFGGLPQYYKFYLGTDNPPTNLVNGEITDTTNFQYTNELSFQTQYYWKVEAYNEFGYSNGTVWSFTTITPPDEDFETNDFTLYDWQFEGSSNWTIDNQNAISGNYCAVSGDIYNNQYSSLKITLDISENGQIIFWKKVSSEENYDKLKFYIDNSLIDQWSGESDWSQEVYQVNAGTHTFKWKYIKLNGGDEGQDKAWIDYIVFPPIGTNNPAELVYYPSEFNITLSENSSTTDTLLLQNTGGENLTYNISIDYSNYQNWLFLSNSNGTIEPNQQDEILITFLSSNLNEGFYIANLMINDNREETLIPINLTVQNVNSQNNATQITKISLNNYPNPFNPQTTISFSLPTSSKISLKIYNIKGEFVKELLNSNLNAGNHKAIWNGTDYRNNHVNSGIYLFQLKTNSKTYFKRALLLK